MWLLGSVKHCAGLVSSGRLSAMLSSCRSCCIPRCAKLRSWPARNFEGRRDYQTRTGVYGYRPKTKKEFKIPDEVLESRAKQSNFHRLVSAYRKYGHRKADINPVNFSPERAVPELSLRRYGLREHETVLSAGILAAPWASGTAREAVQLLEEAYCGRISAEFDYLEDEEEREWFAERMERLPSETLARESRVALATELLKAQTLDRFLASKFVTLKRYGGEGAESMMGAVTEMLRVAAEDGVQQVVVGMPHRGRFNLQTGVLRFRPARLFQKLQGFPELPPDARASGDVPTHFSSSVDVEAAGKQIHVIVLNNPSHLEVVNPVSMGKTRAKQQALGDGDYSPDPATRWGSKVINLQIHGDAALAGQGVNQETLQLSAVPHFQVGGSVHLVVNNQLGFTTPAECGRSSRYASDVGKMAGAPALHANGNFPELVVKAARVAAQYQRKFRKDVFVDLNCYRKWGHNELDDPTFTNPALYRVINSQKTVPDAYADELVNAGVLTRSDVSDIVEQHSAFLSEELKRADTYKPERTYFLGKWSGMSQAPAAVTTWDTGCDPRLLQHVGSRSVTLPPDFTIHPRLEKMHVKPRLVKLAQGTNIDWSTAETLAFGSLLYQGYNVRLSGQDVGRGTFSHRHVMLVDQETNDTYIPLNSLTEEQSAHLEVANSILSEEAVLAYEYGMSIESPRNLVVWEAQFGDFFNGAQIVVDTFISGGESTQVGGVQRAGAAPAARHGRRGARAQLVPRGALPAAERQRGGPARRGEREPARGRPQLAGPVLPPAARPGAEELPQAAGGGRSQDPAAAAGSRLLAERHGAWHVVPPGHR
ncbi:probable 2-oxoglutarate dehydrogenase E1 component DHKTD1 homolog, mitochondrial isoform X2 [Bacillus rossius redtenbacheri]|uniref:probable 2-oxoglutarate dehydrogenase E1 component DHKTD1 homolog, mitochondrial isoform X2 n=1 Tax=Bacillus rossius redtenbacheri TaxID=93214 RepID=UPI002FDC8E5C